MGHTICIGNHKGGVGKTTTAISLSAALAIAEKKTLLIDIDPKGNATTGLGINKKMIKKSLHRGFLGEATADELIIGSDIEALKIIPARMDLFRTEAEILTKSGKEKLLDGLLKDIKASYDYIIIDSPPSLNLLTMNALTAADSMLIPLQCEFYAVECLDQLFKFYNVLKKNFNPALRIEGILLTMYEEDEMISRQIAQNAKTHFKEMLFEAIIPKDRGFRESALHKKPLLLYDINSSGARSYLDLAKEIIHSEMK